MKKIIIAIVLLIIGGGVFAFWPSLSKTDNIRVYEEEPGSRTVAIYEKIATPGRGDDFKKLSFSEGKTALELLKYDNEVVTQGEGENAFITQINGVKANTNKKEFWAFYVNGKQAEVGAGTYKIKEGDKIEWKIETY